MAANVNLFQVPTALTINYYLVTSFRLSIEFFRLRVSLLRHFQILPYHSPFIY